MKVPFNNLRLLHEPLLDRFAEALAATIQSSSYIGGSSVFNFEDSFSSILNICNTISCANGTDALFVALKSLGCGPGDQVITTSLSWISTSEAISLTGATPVFCDIHPNTFTIDPNKILPLINRSTVGILPVHLYGHPCDLSPILDIANSHNLWVVEDCAQSHLSTYNDQFVGTFGQLSTFSFYPGKNLGALGDAGCIVTNNPDLARWCRLFSNHGGKGVHEFEGINSRLDALQASFLSIKLPYLQEWTTRRRLVADLYSKRLAHIPQIKTPLSSPNGLHSFHLYTVIAQERDALRSYLSELGVQTIINYAVPLPFLPAYRHLEHDHASFPVVSDVTSAILCLPMHPYLTEEEVGYVAHSINKFYQKECLYTLS